MYIAKIEIKNFRILEEATLELNQNEKKDLTLLIGRNNSGKTSFIVLFEKFLNTKRFIYDDFSISLRDKILSIDNDTDEHELSIKLLLKIVYTKDDDSLEYLSEFILDLDTSKHEVLILFECSINKKKLLSELAKIKTDKEGYIQKNLEQFLNCTVYALEDESHFSKKNRNKLIKKEWKHIDSLINCQTIHAKRNVASSESGDRSTKVLSTLTTAYFNKENQFSFDEQNKINESLSSMDESLNSTYENFFDDFLRSAKSFLDMDDLKVISDLKSKEILTNHSRIVYGEKESVLPEYLNGLGFMNILYLLLNIEIKRRDFNHNKRDINLFFIEEPEAHTHPQMQYVFIEKIEKTLKELNKVQTIISTHSAHIVKRCDFKDIRYFLLEKNNGNISNAKIKNFYNELEKKYINEFPNDELGKENFRFLNQYLTIASSELFFAEKIIFIEGTTERLLLPYFIREFDRSRKEKKLSSQNVSILEVGANARAFKHFLEFLGIKTLIITDIDTTKLTVNPPKKKGEKEKITYPKNPVIDSTHTSNYSIEYFLNAPKRNIDKDGYKEWMEKLKKDDLNDENSIIKVSYQSKEENGYNGRSFEDAFISINLETLKKHIDNIDGLRYKNKIDDYKEDYYKLTDNILDPKEKSKFASSLLFLALSNDDINWNTPNYIKKGLEWITQ